MTAEQVEPVVWRVSSSNIKDAVQTLRNAEKTHIDRLRVLNGSRVAQWPGYKIRIYVSRGAQLFADPTHGGEMYEISQKILDHGLRAGMRIEIDW